ncbi:hypothetical protein SLEP1_g46108 [Rubroshorea leprosula]|uniref:Uncharacterized protein n=1 Tax=Rubroshorea leprosula TaxID=152421 RepID=A0AAV5LLD1_9ROSI|nr:hypothetical protein SLEP1_g46108 [Rubroshorea leprosula]
MSDIKYNEFHLVGTSKSCAPKTTVPRLVRAFLRTLTTPPFDDALSTVNEYTSSIPSLSNTSLKGHLTLPPYGS